MLSVKTPKKVAEGMGHEQCAGCLAHCKMGSGALEPDDLHQIAKFLRLTELELKQKYLEKLEKFNTGRFRPKMLRKGNAPYGTCIFFSNEAGCTINSVRPLQCRTSSCGPENRDLQKWNDLFNFFNKDDPESIRQYSIWLEFNEPLPGGTLMELVGDEKAQQALSYEEVLKWPEREKPKPRI